MPKSPSSTTPPRGVSTLVEAARRGDPKAWAAIVKELGPRLRGYARARGAPDPDDVMQDVFLAAAERIADFDGEDPAFRSWLFSIAYRQVANRHRVSGREIAVSPAHIDRGANDDPYQQVEASESASAAVRAMHVLNDIEKDVVLMRVIAELDTDQVAAAVGKEPGNVRVIQSRAMTKLRAELEKVGYESRRSDV